MAYNGLSEKAADRNAIRQFAKATKYNSYSELDSHWHLAVLAVLPRHQRRGIGTELIDWGLETASRELLPVTLEASLSGRALYGN
jgi:ribosomal protein S18 acetylase RimI-like enzyme